MRLITHVAPHPLPQLDELFLDCPSAKLGVEDRRGVDELGGLLEAAGVEVGQARPYRASNQEADPEGGLQSQPLDVEGS